MKIKQFKWASISLSILLITGCSFSSPSVKAGAISGGISGAVVGGLLGAGVGGAKGSSKGALLAGLLGAVIVGAIGVGLGAGVGYVVDSSNDNEEMQSMIEEQKLLETQEVK